MGITPRSGLLQPIPPRGAVFLASNLSLGRAPADKRAGPDTVSGGSYPRKWLTLAVVAVGVFMAVLDSSMVNISLPTITLALGTDLATVQWVVTAYLLTITSLLLSFGRLADIVGRKPVYIVGFVVFTVASGLCGAAQSVEQLIVLRAIQGVGAAMTMAMGPAITTAAFPPSERGKALGLNATVVAMGASLGPSLGGLLIRVLDWRAVFFARVPVGLLGIVLAVAVLREQHLPAERQRFDLAGAGLLSLGLSALLLGLNRGQQDGWGSTSSVLLLTAFGALLVAFVALESRVAQPMLDLSLFRHRVFAAANTSSMLSFVANSGSVFLTPFLLTGGLGFGAAEVGLLMTASPLAIAVVGPISGWLSDRYGSRWLSSLGLLISCVGLLLLSRLGPGSSAVDVAASLAVTGVGGGLFQSPNNSAIMGSVSRDRLGIASGMLATMRNLGMALGVALAGAVYSTRSAHYGSGAPAAPGSGADLVASMGAFHDAYLVAAAFAFIGVFTSLVRGKERK